ncbi:hypothetical protein AgCh_007646 [Apium graveolens]
MVQSIPVNVEYSPELYKIILKGSQDGNWVQRHQPCITIWDSRLRNLVESVIGDVAVAEYQEWYLNITRKYHSRLGALHGFVGDLLKDIAERTRETLPYVSLKASEEWRHVQHHSHGGGHGGVRAARGRVDGGVPDPVVPVQGDGNYIAENLGNYDDTLHVEEDRDTIHTEGDAILTEAHDDVNAKHNRIVRDDLVVPEDHDMGNLVIFRSWK